MAEAIASVPEIQTGGEQSGGTGMPPGGSGGKGQQRAFGTGSLPPVWAAMDLRLDLGSWECYPETGGLQG